MDGLWFGIVEKPGKTNQKTNKNNSGKGKNQATRMKSGKKTQT
jgi:hypothetical protein